MPAFKVTAKMTTILETTIEADSLEQAQEIADTIDGGDFEEIDNGGDWSVYDVEATEESND